MEDVERADGRNLKASYAFPGGRRFRFTEPSGDEPGVWVRPWAPRAL